MSERTEKFADALDRLIREGEVLSYSIQNECYPDAFKTAILSNFDGDDAKASQYIKKMPSFKSEYQKWYSEALSVVRYLLPDRFSDFKAYFEYPRVRRSIDFENYMIKDYLQGLRVTRGLHKEVVVDGGAAIPEFFQQLSIVKAARATLDSNLRKIRNIVQADVFDSEIDSARSLAVAGYLRAAGAICGVVIEKHLLSVCREREIPIRKKKPGISDLNQALRDADVITVPDWRFVQHLADIRNICDHATGREPTKEELESLVSGSERVLKTIY